MLNVLIGKVVTELIDCLGPSASPTLLDMGNQTFSITPAEMEDLVRTTGTRKANALLKLSERHVTGKTVTKLRETRSATLEAVLKDEAGKVPMTRSFYETLGFVSAESIDVNSRHGAMVMDLNKDLVEDYGFRKKYTLVINNGTSEHLFCQESFFKNAHQLTEIGGYMLHALPFMKYVNHGFFNYQPAFFQDLAAANGYEIMRLEIADRNGSLADLLKPSDTLTRFWEWSDHLTENEDGNLLIVALLQKKTAASFAIPLQGKYFEDIESEEHRRTYKAQTRAPRPSKGFYFNDPEKLKYPVSRWKYRVKHKLLVILRKITRAAFIRLWPDL